jgi:hypothetical protein
MKKIRAKKSRATGSLKYLRQNQHARIYAPDIPGKSKKKFNEKGRKSEHQR